MFTKDWTCNHRAISRDLLSASRASAWVDKLYTLFKLFYQRFVPGPRARDSQPPAGDWSSVVKLAHLSTQLCTSLFALNLTLEYSLTFSQYIKWYLYAEHLHFNFKRKWTRLHKNYMTRVASRFSNKLLKQLIFTLFLLTSKKSLNFTLNLCL